MHFSFQEITGFVTFVLFRTYRSPVLAVTHSNCVKRGAWSMPFGFMPADPKRITLKQVLTDEFINHVFCISQVNSIAYKQRVGRKNPQIRRWHIARGIVQWKSFTKQLKNKSSRSKQW